MLKKHFQQHQWKTMKVKRESVFVLIQWKFRFRSLLQRKIRSFEENKSPFNTNFLLMFLAKIVCKKFFLPINHFEIFSSFISLSDFDEIVMLKALQKKFYLLFRQFICGFSKLCMVEKAMFKYETFLY